MSVPSSLNPWQQALWQNLLSQTDRIAHALLFYGQAGIGKQAFVRLFAQRLLCLSPKAENVCGDCQSCLLFEYGNHPDYCFIHPEKEAGMIKIDQIRELVSFSQHTPQISTSKVIVLKPAEAMNISASNALLKTLEEPTKNTYLFLISDHMSLLTPTILSRCQKVNMPVPPEETIDPVLLQQRAVLLDEFAKLFDHTMDVTTLAQAWSGYEPEFIVEALQQWLIACIRYQYFPDETSSVSKISSLFSLISLYEIYDELIKIKHTIQMKIALNKPLLIENILMQWTHRV